MPRLHPKEHCRACFQLLENSSPICQACSTSCTELRLAAVFSYDSPASALIKQLKYGGREELAPLMASWMIVQLEDLGFPWPDAIIPVPQSFPRRLVRGLNPSHQLAAALSKLMRVPLSKPLKRTWTALPQASKNARERSRLSKEEFILRPSVSLTGKKILIIDDVMTTGTTLKRCAEAIRPAFPYEVYGLGFCLA